MTMSFRTGADPGWSIRALYSDSKQLLQRRRPLARRGLPPPQTLRVRRE